MAISVFSESLASPQTIWGILIRTLNRDNTVFVWLFCYGDDDCKLNTYVLIITISALAHILTEKKTKKNKKTTFLEGKNGFKIPFGAIHKLCNAEVG